MKIEKLRRHSPYVGEKFNEKEGSYSVGEIGEKVNEIINIVNDLLKKEK